MVYLFVKNKSELYHSKYMNKQYIQIYIDIWKTIQLE